MSLQVDAVDFVDLAGHAGPGDDTVFVALHAGSATGWYGPLSASLARTAHAVGPAVLGSDATDHDALHQRLAQVAPRTRAGSWAVGALDCAAWDLHSRTEDRPVAALLTRAPHTQRVPAYSSWLSRDLSHPGVTDLVSQIAAQGWAFTKWGMRHQPDTSGGALAEHLHAAASVEPVAVDAVGTWPPTLQAEFATATDPTALVWLEDPAPTHDPALCRNLFALPLAIGERLTLHDDVAAVLDTIQPAALTLDVVGCGGLTAAQRILAHTTTPVYPHGRTLQPALHLAAAHQHRVPAVEYRQQWEPGRQRLYASPVEPHAGFLPLPVAPGLGAMPRSGPC